MATLPAGCIKTCASSLLLGFSVQREAMLLMASASLRRRNPKKPLRQMTAVSPSVAITTLGCRSLRKAGNSPVCVTPILCTCRAQYAELAKECGPGWLKDVSKDDQFATQLKIAGFSATQCRIRVCATSVKLVSLFPSCFARTRRMKNAAYSSARHSSVRKDGSLMR